MKSNSTQHGVGPHRGHLHVGLQLRSLARVQRALPGLFPPLNSLRCPALVEWGFEEPTTSLVLQPQRFPERAALGAADENHQRQESSSDPALSHSQGAAGIHTGEMEDSVIY